MEEENGRSAEIGGGNEGDEKREIRREGGG